VRFPVVLRRSGRSSSVSSPEAAGDVDRTRARARREH
jgi:hypothetical protein